MCDWSSTWSSGPPSLQAALWAHMQLEQHLGSIPSWAAVGWGTGAAHQGQPGTAGVPFCRHLSAWLLQGPAWAAAGAAEARVCRQHLEGCWMYSGTAPNLSAGVASNIWPASCNLAGSFLPSTTLGHMNSKRTPQPADMRRCLTWGSCQTSLAGGTVCTQGSMSASWLHWVQKAASQWLQSRWVEAQSRASWTPACPLYLSSGVL